MKLSAIGMYIWFIATIAIAQSPAEPPPTDDRLDYGIGIEDVLRVSVWGETALDLRARVRPDGKITVPLVNDIKVEGLTPEQVRQEITRRLSNYIREPNVTVSVEEINSFRVYVLGEVTRQGPINLFRPARILQVIASAGGITQYSKKEITILREEGGGERRIRIDYKKLLAGDPAQSNVFLKPGDTVLVD
ncbi:MAG: polysaccharide biosynthesis/export family protein [Acidobacteriia bacterium]|nr:polysaccharide biosynthesis/export family protein [Terriglobia bacterium]